MGEKGGGNEKKRKKRETTGRPLTQVEIGYCPAAERTTADVDDQESRWLELTSSNLLLEDLHARHAVHHEIPRPEFECRFAKGGIDAVIVGMRIGTAGGRAGIASPAALSCRVADADSLSFTLLVYRVASFL